MALDTPVPRASTALESLPARARRVAARAGLPLAGGGLLGGSGLATVMAAGACPLCAAGVSCPVCLLGAGPALGGVATGSLGTLDLAIWTDSSPPDDADSDDDGETDGSCGRTCEC